MRIPLYVLACGAIFAGYLGVTLAPGPETFLGIFRPHGFFHAYLGHSTLGHPEPAHGGAWLMYVSALVAIAGILLAWARYGRAPETDPDRRAFGWLWNVFNAKWYFDEIYDRVFVRPLRNLGRLLFATDNVGVDGVIRLVVAVPRSLAFVLHFLQRGALQTYAAGMVIGLVILLLFWNWVK